MPKRAGDGPHNPTAAKVDEFADFERDQWQRPRIPRVGKVGRDDLPRAGYTRASTLGGTLEDQFGLGQWRMRQVAYGLSRRADLVLAVQALRTNDGPEDKKALGRIADKALEAAESSAGATIGTAIHALTDHADTGGDVSHVSGEARDALVAWASITAGFGKLAIEARVVCDTHRVAGTFDRLFQLLGPMITPDGERLPAGTIVMGDLKTASTADHFGIKFAVQLAEYAHGVPFDTGTYGRTSWDTLGGRPHQKWALIIHIPTGNPDGADLYWVDVESGAMLSALAIAVREQRSRRDLVVRASAPSLPEPHTPASLLLAVQTATDRERVDVLWRANKPIWSDEHTAAARLVLGAVSA